MSWPILSGIQLTGLSDLMRACENGDIDGVRELIGAGADISQTDNTKRSALTYAGDNRHSDIPSHGHGTPLLHSLIKNAGIPSCH